MNLFKFYRLDFCIRNLGLGIIAIFSLEFIPQVSKTILALLQILLIQMHSFSMNNYLDGKIWKEKNYTYELISKGMNENFLFFLMVLPLLLLFLTIPFSNRYFFILLAYIILFALYQLPIMRGLFKSHYLPSIIINSLCLGTILYIYPYLFLAKQLTLTATAFSIVFFFYLAFHEVVHQIAHLGRDEVHSLPKVIGIEGSVRVGMLFLVIAMGPALFAIVIDPIKYFFFTGTILFSGFRIYKLKKIKPIQENFIKLRSRKDKFYSFQEGLYYIIFLTLNHIFPYG